MRKGLCAGKKRIRAGGWIRSVHTQYVDFSHRYYPRMIWVREYFSFCNAPTDASPENDFVLDSSRITLTLSSKRGVFTHR